MLERISNFYISSLSTLTSGRSEANAYQVKVHPFSQFNFVGAIGISSLFLIQKIALSALYLTGSVATCFLHENTRNYFFQNLQDIPVYLGAFVLGHIGLLFPRTVSEKVLGIPSSGLMLDDFPSPC
jgi:hypothetical protein